MNGRSVNTVEGLYPLLAMKKTFCSNKIRLVAELIASQPSILPNQTLRLGIGKSDEILNFRTYDKLQDFSDSEKVKLGPRLHCR